MLSDARPADAATEARRREGRVLVAGLGNELLSDDGVGVHAVRALRRAPACRALAVDVGTAILDALPLIEEAEVVIAIDAMQAGGAPGSIYSLDPADAESPAYLAGLHELGLAGALPLLRRRPEIVVYGVEPASLSPGLALSPAVRDSLPRLLELVRDRIRALAC